MALSATCPPNIISSILTILNVSSNTVTFQLPLHRPNLRYSVVEKCKSQEDLAKQLFDYITTNHLNECGIIYCLTKKDTEQITMQLLSKGLKCAVYHADLDDYTRDQVHVNWRAGKVDIVVATIAFGLGIDQPRVRFVIHSSLSKSLEGYYQESGRAGRDGLPSDCVLFYKRSDIWRLSTMVVTESEGLSMLYSMVKYCEDVKTCRRKLMEAYFGDIFSKQSEACGVCDHCLASCTVEEMDITEDARQLVALTRCLISTNEKPTFLRLVDIWSGNGKKPSGLTLIQREGVRLPVKYSKEVCS